ncbi:hypothetical protein CQW23_25714 [Capsicum baccatum]|uniref:Uncharacterized protein n=1 Tax=Capsicum baccatum TaxID=33114 RepID=A0A2G2VLR3_CAPBA|nr:hypothetical protein CQW23_25714 [Capsicum baccatum]
MLNMINLVEYSLPRSLRHINSVIELLPYISLTTVWSSEKHESSIGDVFLSYFSGLASSGDLGDSVQTPHMNEKGPFNDDKEVENVQCWWQKQSVGSNLVGMNLSLGSSSASPDEHADSQDHDEQDYNQNHDGDNSDRSTLFPAIDRYRSINYLNRY